VPSEVSSKPKVAKPRPKRAMAVLPVTNSTEAEPEASPKPLERRPSNDAKAARAAKAARSADRFKPMTSQELLRTITELEQELADEQRRVENICNPTGSVSALKIRLGQALLKSTANPAELAKSFAIDTKGRSKGELTMMEFRKSVRKVVDWPNVKDIDGLFQELDADSGGTLDLKELAGFMKKLQEEATFAQGQTEVAQERVGRVTVRRDSARLVMDATAEAEKLDSQLKAEMDNPTIAARLGKELVTKGMKIADLVNSWESTEGEIDQTQFRKNVRRFGIEGEDASMDELFSELDKDGGGTLDLDELRSSLSKLRDAANDSDKSMQHLRKAVEKSWKQAKTLQLELRKQRKAEEAEVRMQQEQAELDAEAVARAAEEAKAAKQAKAMAKKQEEKEAKEAYEKQIQERRKSRG